MPPQPSRALRHTNLNGITVSKRDVRNHRDSLSLYARSKPLHDTVEQHLLKPSFPSFP